MSDSDVERLAALLADKLKSPKPPALTWAKLWAIYEPREVEKLEAPATQRSMGRHVVRLLGPEAVEEMSSERIARYRAQRRSELNPAGSRNAGKPPSQKTVNNEVILIRRLTKWAANQRPPLIERDPLAGVEQADLLVPVENVRLNVVEDDPEARLSLEQFLERADPFERAMVLVAHSSGIRRRELALLQLEWLDFHHRLINIPPGIAKGRRGRKKGRSTIVSEEALIAVRQYRATLSAAAYETPWVFVNRRRLRPYHKDYFTRRFAKLERRVGVAGPSGPTWLHDLRRSFITLTRRRGTDAIAVMKLVGHTTLESQERYHIESMEETIRLRDQIEDAREKALAELRLVNRRRPHAVPGSGRLSAKKFSG